jgi:hypothetical protein
MAGQTTSDTSNPCQLWGNESSVKRGHAAAAEGGENRAEVAMSNLSCHGGGKGPVPSPKMAKKRL